MSYAYIETWIYLFIFLKIITIISEHKTRVFAAIVEMLRWFAGHQIRNVAVSVYLLIYFNDIILLMKP